MASFAYYEGRRHFAWDIDKLSKVERTQMEFTKTALPTSGKMNFRSSYDKQSGSFVRAAFCDPSNSGGGESLTHLLFKETIAVQHKFRWFERGDKNSYYIGIKDAFIEQSLYSSSGQLFKIDVAVTLSHNSSLRDIWGEYVATEILHSHAVDEQKAECLLRAKMTCMEIPVPADLVIEDGDNLNEAIIKEHVAKIQRYIDENALEVVFPSKCFTDKYYREQIAGLLTERSQMEVEIRAKNNDVAVLERNVRMIESSLQAEVQKCKESENRIKSLTANHARVVKDQSEVITLLKDSILKLEQTLHKWKTRKFWARWRNTDPEA